MIACWMSEALTSHVNIYVRRDPHTIKATVPLMVGYALLPLYLFQISINPRVPSKFMQKETLLYSVHFRVSAVSRNKGTKIYYKAQWKVEKGSRENWETFDVHDPMLKMVCKFEFKSQNQEGLHKINLIGKIYIKNKSSMI
ncbi:hypothetical protein VNO80_12009 [Phaseolus coccineus]|uniref:Uncharacterized protein n=1 Tax=Phaseolus coccineus TaxID=3886 RepID=A0AAN9NBL4_PHACN